MITKLEEKPEKLNRDKMYLLSYHYLGNIKMRVYYAGGRRKKWREHHTGNCLLDSHTFKEEVLLDMFFSYSPSNSKVKRYEMDSLEDLEKLKLAWELEK